MSDAFVSLDLDSGKVHWWRQTTPYDIWRVICTPTGIPGKPHCASDSPMDFDFASSASFVRLPGGRGALVALQKSGVVHAVDAATGTQLWSVRVAKGGEYAQWGSAADDRNVYAAIADIGTTRREFVSDMDLAPDRGGGLVALRLADGRRVWSAPPVPCGTRTRCSPGQVAAVSVVPGAVFSGSLDGHIRAYSTANGQVVWDFDTHREFKTVNKVPGAGGSINGPGPIFGEGMMFLSSGFVHLGGAPGNVLLAFSVDGK